MQQCPPPKPLSILALSCLLASCGPQLSEEEKEEQRLSEERAETIGQIGDGGLKHGMWDVKLVIDDIEIGSLSEKRKAKLMKSLERKGSGAYCLTQDGAASPPAGFFAGGLKNCSFGKFQKVSDNVKMQVACETGSVGSLEMDLTGPISGDEYSLAGNMGARIPVVGRVNMHGMITGKFTGKSCSD